MTTLLTKKIINLSDNQNTAQALSRFEEMLGTEAYTNHTLGVVLGEMVFTQGHMARLKTLAGQYNIRIEKIYTSAVQTQLAALNSGLTVSEKAPADQILEEFKNSFDTANESMETPLNETPKDHNVEQQIYNVEISEPLTLQPSQEVQSEAPQPEVVENTQILPDADSNTQVEFHTLNEVIEILNTEAEMVQHKIELPFEQNFQKIETFDPQSKKKMTTMYINQTLRSGQTITYDGNVVIAGDTHPGSEVIAGGDIIVWGTLGGIAHAGAGNYYKASIRALKMDPIQLRIADYIARRPDKNTDFKKEMEIKPEVARISNGEIKIFSLK